MAIALIFTNENNGQIAVGLVLLNESNKQICHLQFGYNFVIYFIIKRFLKLTQIWFSLKFT
jgi:hypothetical protein